MSKSVFFQPVLIAAGIVIILVGLKAAAPVVTPILFAFYMTIILLPIVKLLQRWGVPQGIAITLILLITIAAVVLLGYYLYVSMNQLIDKLPYYQARLAEQFKGFSQLLNSWGVTIPKELPKQTPPLSAVVQATVGILSAIFASGVGLFFFFLELILMISIADTLSDKFKKHYAKARSFPHHFAEWSTDIQHQFNIQTSNNLFTAILVGVAYFVLGIDFALLWMIITFVFAYIPNIGVILSSIPPIILAFIQYGPQKAIITLILIVVLNQVMDSIVTPRMMGKGLRTPSLVVFLSFLLWSWILGPLGAFLALPFTLAIRSLLLNTPSTKFSAELLTEEEKPKKEKEDNK